MSITSKIAGVLIIISLFSACKREKDIQNRPNDQNRLTTTEFETLLHEVSNGWNSNDARMAADCFTLDAIYTEPPNRQLYKGREELFDFFGGENGRTSPMNMTWHHLVFDEADQIGMAEYTFKYKGRATHGIVIVQVAEKKIRRWREYQYRSDMEWDEFIGLSSF